MRAVSILAAGLSAGAAFSACGNGDDAFVPAPVASVDGGADASRSLDATASDGAEVGPEDAAAHDAPEWDGAPTPTLALLRVANWSADSPAIDVCLAPHGTGAFRGPILGAQAASINAAGVLDAGSGALSFPQATGYLVVDPAQYDARLVAGGSTDCSAMITQDATNLPELVGGAAGTIALVGAASPQHGEPALEVIGFLDDLTSNLPTAFELRAINAAPDLPKVDVGTLSGGALQSALVGVPFGATSAGVLNVGRSMPNGNGYVPVTPLVNAILAASASVPTLLDGAAHAIVAQSAPVNAGVGATVTVAVVGSRGQAPAQIIECVDNGAVPGLAGNCQIVSQ